jgi:predicted nuclease of predicted toxin-antitoxin system
VRVKLDEDVPLRVRALLAEHGHDAETVREEGLGGASDAEVLRAARAEGRMLVSLDLGFADIRHYPPGGHPGIVVVRLQDQRAAHVEAVVREFLGSYAVEHTGRLHHHRGGGSGPGAPRRVRGRMSHHIVQAPQRAVGAEVACRPGRDQTSCVARRDRAQRRHPRRRGLIPSLDTFYR